MSFASVLVVDDDYSDRQLIQGVLTDVGCRTTGIPDGASALDFLRNNPVDLVFLDLGLPGIDGFEVLRRIRRLSAIPVIAVSGSKSLEDRVKFISLGGDDYITKPFEINELLFRTRVVLNRSGRNNSFNKARFDDGFLEIDFELRRVSAARKEVALPPREYDLLHEFVTNIGKTLTHQQLMNKIWGHEYLSDISLLHTCVARLRSKIEPDHSRPHYVITIPRVGYRFQTS